MIRFGVRLAVAGGRAAVARLLTVAAAVALGSGLLLATLAGINAVNTQNTRYAWLNSGGPPAASATSDTGALLWRLREDYFAGQPIARVDVAATGADSPVPPGMTSLPGPGEYWVSPALATLLTTTPADQLADRYPGRRVGTLGPAALASPELLVIVVGYAPEQLRSAPDVRQVTSFTTLSPDECQACPVGTRAAGMDLILAVVAGALLFPLLLFIGAATRLSAARREQRFAAMRLIGATPRQVSVISAVESTVATIAGTLAGFALFFAFRAPIAAIPFTGLPFYPADLSLNRWDVLAVAVGVPAGAAVAALLALRRVRISPLGVTRRVTSKPPSAARIVPLLSGITELAWFIGRRPQTSMGQVEAFLPGFLVIMAGLVIAGPWLTMVGSRLLARRARRADALIAARRLADDPKTGFRAISGLVVALFVTSVATGVITTIVAERGTDPASATHTIAQRFFDDGDTATSVPAGVTASLGAVPGVQGVIVVRDNRGGDLGPDGVVSCADLARVPQLGSCPAGAATALVFDDMSPLPASPRGSGVEFPAAALAATDLDSMRVLSIVVATDGATATVERARTILEGAYPDQQSPPAGEADWQSDFTNTLTAWQRLANVVILSSLPIAGCSLAVSVVGGLSERKRPFSLLRLTGVPVRMLRRVVALESAVPLLIVAVVAIGVGFLAADLFLQAQLGYRLVAPGLSYYLIVALGLVASLGIIASTMPVLARITGPETARND